MRNFMIGWDGRLIELLTDPVDSIAGCPFAIGDGKTWKLFYNEHNKFNKHPKLTLLQYWMAVVIYLVERNLKYT